MYRRLVLNIQALDGVYVRVNFQAKNDGYTGEYVKKVSQFLGDLMIVLLHDIFDL